MAQEGYARWLKDNSIATPVEVSLVDGTRLKGLLQLPRERTLRDVMNGGDPFIEFHCQDNGPTVLSKQSILSLRPFRLPPADQLKRRQEFLDQIGAERALGITRPVTRAELQVLYRRLATLYHPDNYPRGRFPDEICEFVISMTRRLYLAYLELDKLLADKESAAAGTAGDAGAVAASTAIPAAEAGAGPRQKVA